MTQEAPSERDIPQPPKEWSRDRYSAYYPIPTPSGYIGLVTCLRCGACIIIDSNAGPELHDSWHEESLT